MGEDKKATRIEKRKKKQKAQEYFKDPIKIIDFVLAQSSHKELNLSKIAEERLVQEDARACLRSIDYDNDRIEMLPIELTTVLPHQEILPEHLRGLSINLSPFATTYMDCVKKAPVRKQRFRKKTKGNQPNNAKQQQSTLHKEGSVCESTQSVIKDEGQVSKKKRKKQKKRSPPESNEQSKSSE